MPPYVDTRPPWIIPVQLLSMSAPAAFQLWVSANFDDAFAPRWWRWLPYASMVTVSALAIAINGAMAWRAAQTAALLLAAVGVWQALAGRDADLVEGRRQFRLFLAVGIGALIVALTVLGMAENVPIRAASGSMIAAGILLFALTVSLYRLRMRPPIESATGPLAAPAPAATPSASTPTVAAPAPFVDPEETALLDRLRHLMEVERLYREEGLGIAKLANRLAIPEYRLRRLINQRLGHRNITSFVNGYRLAETTAALADPNQAQVPILTIALDAGFQSIGPFNRAFKAHTGLTPTAFRRGRLGGVEARAAE
jgi:AraC-like DNA-binding protein